MAECYKCGISKEKATLYEGVSVSGIVNVCRKCFFIQKMPLLEHKKVDWSEVDRVRTVRERLNRMSGFKNNDNVKTYEPTQKDQELRRLVEKNFQENSLADSVEPEDLIPNFNWVIMRKRRALKLSLKGFADRIYVPESIADSIERGILPKDYKGLIRKVENSLDINLFAEKKFKIRPEDLATEAKVPSGALISEVKDVFTPKREDMFYAKNSEKKLDNVTKNLIETVKGSSEFSDSYEIDASELNLENVEDMFGIPEPKEEVKKLNDYTFTPLSESSGHEENSKEESVELSDEDIKKFAWGN